MGKGIMINAKPAAKQNSLQRLFQVDIILVIVVVVLAVTGLVMVFSSSWNFSLLASEYTSTTYAVKRQIFWMILGAIIAWVVSHVDYHFYRRFLVPMIIVTIGMLIAVFFSPPNEFGAHRTLFNGSIQPSELAKVATVIYVSFWLFSKREVLNSISFGIIPLAVILGVIGGLIVIEPDLSAALTIFVLGGILFFLADAELRQIVMIVLIMTIIGVIFLRFSPSGLDRVMEYWNGLQNPSSASDHVQYSLRSFTEGGLLGKGLGKGSIKYTGLPVAWTDSIYAVIAEEMGILGAVAIMGLYIIFLWRGLKIAKNAPDKLGSLLAGGITFWVLWEAIINMGVLVNVFPFAGNALPLISTGGSNLVTVLFAIGILLNISRSGTSENDTPNDYWRKFGKAADLRRRNRRRSISRTDRIAHSRR